MQIFRSRPALTTAGHGYAERKREKTNTQSTTASVSVDALQKRLPYASFLIHVHAHPDPLYQSTASIPGGLARGRFRSDLSAPLRLALRGLETKPVSYEEGHGPTLRVWVFMGVPSHCRASLERIITYHGGPELREL